ncbi:MAG: ABC transporter ATP-binding protein [Clostridium sp.]|nr:ABC transporter ATP-binding protein [Clostridium sp.]
MSGAIILMDEMKLLTVSDIYKSYKEKEVLKGISFDLNTGDIYGLIGPNGIGKTTIIKSVTGLVKFDSGTITFKENHDKVGLVLDQNCLYSQLTGSDNIEFYVRMFGQAGSGTTERVLRLVDLYDVKDKKVLTYSKGMKRRLVLARTLAFDPNLLILDEPFDGLDLSSQMTMIKCLKQWVGQGNRGILYTSHNMSEVKMFCNRLGFIKDGKIAKQGNITDLLRDSFKCLRIVPQSKDVQQIINCIGDFIHTYKLEADELKLFMDEENINAVYERLKAADIALAEFNKEYKDLIDIYVGVNGIETDND